MLSFARSDLGVVPWLPWLLVAGACNNTGTNNPGSPPEPGGSLKVVLEVDCMAGMPPLKDAQTIGELEVSLPGIYEAADIELEVVHDETDLPVPGRLTLGDLHAIMTQHRGTDRPGDASVYALVATQDADDPGTLGIMFDFDSEAAGVSDENGVPREGFAIFADAHRSLAGGVEREMLLTAAHELAHCFNIHHTDWDGSTFLSDSTIESYSMTDSVRWKLSPQSLAHLTAHPRRLVLMGPGSLPFGCEMQAHLDLHKSVPSESYVVVDAARLDEIRRRVDVDKEATVRGLPSGASARRSASPLRLELKPGKASYELAEPVTLIATVTNTGTVAAPVTPLLRPSFGFLRLGIRKEGSPDALPFRTLELAEGRGRAFETLAPGESIEEECPIFFGATGWTFTQPGRYVVEAGFNNLGAGDRGADWIPAEPIALEIAAATDAASRDAAKLVLNGQSGLFLYFGGGDHLHEGKERLESSVLRYPDTVQADGARLALGLAALEPTYDPTRRAQPRPSLDRAQALLGPLLESELPPVQVIQAQRRLAEALDEANKPMEALKVRYQTIQKFAPGQALPDVQALRDIDLKAAFQCLNVDTFRSKVDEKLKELGG